MKYSQLNTFDSRNNVCNTGCAFRPTFVMELYTRPSIYKIAKTVHSTVPFLIQNSLSRPQSAQLGNPSRWASFITVQVEGVLVTLG